MNFHIYHVIKLTSCVHPVICKTDDIIEDIIDIIDTHLALKWFEVKPSKNDRQTLYVKNLEMA